MIKKSLLVALTLVALLGTHSSAANEPVAIVSGTIMPLAEDPSGHVLQVEIQPSDGESYVVYNDEKGRQLLRFVGDYVVASGIVRMDQDGWKTLHVRSYQLTEDDGTITPGVGVP